MRSIIRAAAILRAGGLVAFPTETVYGLGADATDAPAVDRIFTAKGRPATNPLICHVADAQMAQRYTTAWPDAASRLSATFWPGALTLVLPKTSDIPDNVTAGLQTIGLRAPAHELALQLIRVLDRPIAGPSANRSNHVSPTTAQHVRDEIGDDVGMILDGGPCSVGIESTVLDLTGATPTILRPGGVSRQEIAAVIGQVDVKSMVTEVTTPAAAPGQHPAHYAPRAPAFRYQRADEAKLAPDAIKLPITSDPIEYARTFYATLRDLDAKQPPAIYIELPPDDPRWTALRDRILRATQPLP